MTDVKSYFEEIAEAATARLIGLKPPVPADQAAIADTVQSVQTALWQATAVHPLQVLETEYQAAVRKAGAGATSDQDRNDRQTHALSRYFALGGGRPTLLDIGASSVADDIARDGLVDEQLKSLHALLGLARSLIHTPSARDTALGAIVPDGEARNISDGLAAAIDYLGLFSPHAPAEVTSSWIRTHQNYTQPAELAELVDELRDKVLKPIEAPANAVASVRGLYNIKPFYLYRLLHRFHGGSADDAMDYDTKGKASGFVTEFMHAPRFAWLTGWHEKEIARFEARLGAVDRALRAAFGRNDAVLRFYLKGGRALYTALGDPAQGANDWDTGILIDPTLSPEQWYIAMATINDVVLLALDKLRFGYTSLLYAHRDELGTWNAPVAVGAAMAGDEEVADYTRLGAIADAQLDRVTTGVAHPAHLLSTAAGYSPMLLGLIGDRGAAPVGVNGELIDIGVPTRSSIELRALWAHLRIARKPGVSGTAVPVPDLAYFIDDFSTILRETLASAGEVDRKFAKRLQRLETLLLANDTALTEAVSARFERLRAQLPRTMEALAPSDSDAADRLRVWTLDALVTSVAGDEPQPRGAWLAAFDDYASDLARNKRLYDPQPTAAIWKEVADFFAKTADQGARAHELLVIQSAAHALAETVAASFVAREKALGVARLSSPNPGGAWTAIANVIASLARLSSAPQMGGARFAITGSLAARMQGMHASLDGDAYAATWPVELVEAAMEVDGLAQAERWLDQIGRFVGGTLKTQVVGRGADARLLFTAPDSMIAIPGAIMEKQPVILMIRPLEKGTLAPDATDQLLGWPVMTTRKLVHALTDRAALAPDYDLRRLAENTLDVLTEQILGRQI